MLNIPAVSINFHDIFYEAIGITDMPERFTDYTHLLQKVKCIIQFQEHKLIISFGLYKVYLRGIHS